MCGNSKHGGATEFRLRGEGSQSSVASLFFSGGAGGAAKRAGSQRPMASPILLVAPNPTKRDGTSKLHGATDLTSRKLAGLQAPGNNRWSTKRDGNSKLGGATEVPGKRRIPKLRQNDVFCPRGRGLNSRWRHRFRVRMRKSSRLGGVTEFRLRGAGSQIFVASSLSLPGAGRGAAKRGGISKLGGVTACGVTDFGPPYAGALSSAAPPNFG